MGNARPLFDLSRAGYTGDVFSHLSPAVADALATHDARRALRVAQAPAAPFPYGARFSLDGIGEAEAYGPGATPAVGVAFTVAGALAALYGGVTCVTSDDPAQRERAAILAAFGLLAAVVAPR